jgi:hypothetical protein
MPDIAVILQGPSVEFQAATGMHIFVKYSDIGIRLQTGRREGRRAQIDGTTSNMVGRPISAVAA